VNVINTVTISNTFTMFILFILGLLLGGVTIVFALQNMAAITVAFLAWHFTGSLALILIIAALAGALVSALLTVPEAIADYFRFESLKKQNKELSTELEAEKKREAVLLAEKEKNKSKLSEKEVIALEAE